MRYSFASPMRRIHETPSGRYTARSPSIYNASSQQSRDESVASGASKPGFRVAKLAESFGMASESSKVLSIFTTLWNPHS
ncbi:hypothetical protein RSSM_02112 [Rhodopirellula sallentina SM41]|uniref:Uncharacterized protein n=1 Tax=Rhodopirellula sallentina SM41 TaxID=1263870 RepID=M5UKB0_9BACT|nr:hypothetical protein RSSM_02112 [Rhodopirellula sallentina SM41]